MDPLTLVLFVLGLGLLIAGAELLVRGASGLAARAGISPLVVGLTVVAFGTSSPELAVSVGAARLGDADIALGNVVGSNIFNVLGVLGLASLISSGGIVVAPSIITFDIPVALAAAFACLPIFFTGYLIARWEGALFVGYYVAYTLYLILAAAEHDALPAYSGAMLGFVLPLTAVTLVVLAARAIRGPRVGPSSRTVGGEDATR